MSDFKAKKAPNSIWKQLQITCLPKCIPKSACGVPYKLCQNNGLFKIFVLDFAVFFIKAKKTLVQFFYEQSFCAIQSCLKNI